MPNLFSSTNAANGAYGILKQWFSGALVSQFNDEIPWYKNVEKGKEKTAGSTIQRLLKLRRNQGIGATSDGGALPAIGQQTNVQASIGYRFNYLRYGITAPMIKASQGDKGAFISAMENEISGGMTDLKQDVNRQLFWDGTSDLATVSVNALASNVITVTGRESTEDGNKFLDIGMMIDIVDTSGNYKAQSISITNLTGTTTATLTLSAIVTCSATDIVVRAGSLNQEVQGILTSQDGGTTSIFGIDRSLYPVFQGNLVGNSGAQLNLNFMKQGWNQGKRRGGAKYDAIYCDFDSERFYEKLLIADKRYVGKVKGDGTFSNKEENYLDYGGVAIVPDKDSPTRFFFLDSSTWKKYVLSELEWSDEGGAQLIPQPGVDAFEARLRLFFNLFCEKPSANVVLNSYISP